MPALKYQNNNNNNNNEHKSVDELLENEQKPALIHRILLNQPFRVIIILLIVSIPIPTLIYMITFSKELFSNASPDTFNGTCGHFEPYHIPCGPINISGEHCIQLHCCYSPTSGCYHYWPSRYQYSIVDTETISETTQKTFILHPMREQTPFGAVSLKQLNFIITELSNERIKMEFNQFSSINDNNNNNNNVDGIDENNNLPPASPFYDYRLDQHYLIIEIFNRENNLIKYLTTSRGPLIASRSQFEWTVYLESSIIFDLNDFVMETRPYRKKLYLANEKQMYSPFIITYNNLTDTFHGIIVDASSPIEMEITESSLIVFRTLNSINFSLELLIGPTFSDIHRQIEERRKRDNSNDLSSTKIHIESIPYWSFGIHVCPMQTIMNTNITEIIEQINRFLNVTQENQIPFDSHCINHWLWKIKDIMMIDSDWIELQMAFEQLHEYEKKVLLTIFPQIEITTNDDDDSLYSIAELENLLLLNGNDLGLLTSYLGIQNDQSIAYIDWTTNDQLTLETFIIEQYLQPRELFDLPIDGYLLENNCLLDETKNLSKSLPTQNYPYQFENLPYQLEYLVPPTTLRAPELNTTSIVLFSILQSYNRMPFKYLQSMHRMDNAKRFKIITNYNLNSNTGTLAKQFNSTWQGLHMAVKNLISESMAGIRLNGAMVCGNSILTDQRQNTIDEELCIRWYQFASISPIFYVTDDRTPDKFSQTAMKTMKTACSRRYQLLAYFHTIYNSITKSNYIIRPMFYDNHTLLNHPSDMYKQQFLLGDALLVAPVILPRVTEKLIYFPVKYFELWGGLPMEIGWNSFSVVLSDLPLFIKAGTIVPLHNSTTSLSAEESRKMPLILIIALNCSADIEQRDCIAFGEFSLSETFNWEFIADNNKLTIKSNSNDDDVDNSELTLCDSNFNIETQKIMHLRIYGLLNDENNGNEVLRLNIDFDACDEEMIIKNEHSIYYYEY